MNKEGNNTSKLECDGKEMDEMPGKEFKRMILILLSNTESQNMR